MEVSELLFSNIIHSEIALDEIQQGTPKYNKLSDIFTHEVITFFHFKAAYFTFLLILSLLDLLLHRRLHHCMYLHRLGSNFRQSYERHPKGLEAAYGHLPLYFHRLPRLQHSRTFIFITLLVLFIESRKFLVPMLILLSIFYFVGFVYMTIAWHLASVVTVLEDTCGIAAMIKSKNLIKGKTRVATVIFLTLIVSFWLIQVVFENLVVHGEPMGMVSRVAYGIICLLLLFKMILFRLVIQTVIYLVCKSYHSCKFFIFVVL